MNKKRISSARFMELEDIKSYQLRLDPNDRRWLDQYKARYLFQRVDGLSVEEKRKIWLLHAHAKRDLYPFVSDSDPRTHETEARAYEIASGADPETLLMQKSAASAAESIARIFAKGA